MLLAVLRKDSAPVGANHSAREQFENRTIQFMEGIGTHRISLPILRAQAEGELNGIHTTPVTWGEFNTVKVTIMGIHPYICGGISLSSRS